MSEERKPNQIDAVLANQMESLLGSLGVLQDYLDGKCRCHICGDAIQSSNLKAVFPMEERRVGFLCNRPECLLDYALTRAS